MALDIGTISNGLGAIMSIFGGGKGQSGSGSSIETYNINDATKGTTAVKKGTAESDAAAKSLLQALMNQMGGTQQYSKDAALADSSQVATTARKNVLDEIGGILSSQNMAGAYSSTGTKRQVEDTGNRAMAAEAAVKADFVNRYAAINNAQQQQQIQGILGALGNLSDSNVMQQVDTNTAKTGTVSKTGTSDTEGSATSGLTGQNIGGALNLFANLWGAFKGTGTAAPAKVE